MPPVEAVLLGAGERGTENVGEFALRHPDKLKIIAIAEPNEEKRRRFATKHNINKENCFKSYVDLLSRTRLAPLCFNTTLDKDHLPSSMMAFEKGYQCFLEKPIAETAEGCKKIVQTAIENNLMLQICHPLRYSIFYKKIKILLDEGAIGRLLFLDMVENVGYWHFSHSFVRGNWGRSETSGPLILTKCCHDMDIASWLIDSKVKRVSSVGDRILFNESNAPEGATLRCIDGCPAENNCIFSANAQYLDEKTDWPVRVISVDSSLEARLKALKEGPYGKCVFKTDNTVVDHQIVNALFENNVIFNFKVLANTSLFNRTIRLIGTEGELNGDLGKSEIIIKKFKRGFSFDMDIEEIQLTQFIDGHGGGDVHLIENFLNCYLKKDYASLKHSLDIALQGHLFSFAAEKARIDSCEIDMENFISKLG